MGRRSLPAQGVQLRGARVMHRPRRDGEVHAARLAQPCRGLVPAAEPQQVVDRIDVHEAAERAAHAEPRRGALARVHRLEGPRVVPAEPPQLAEVHVGAHLVLAACGGERLAQLPLARRGIAEEAERDPERGARGGRPARRRRPRRRRRAPARSARGTPPSAAGPSAHAPRRRAGAPGPASARPRAVAAPARSTRARPRRPTSGTRRAARRGARRARGRRRGRGRRAPPARARARAAGRRCSGPPARPRRAARRGRRPRARRRPTA